jgi:hypothetical protein
MAADLQECDHPWGGGRFARMARDFARWRHGRGGRLLGDVVRFTGFTSVLAVRMGLVRFCLLRCLALVALRHCRPASINDGHIDRGFVLKDFDVSQNRDAANLSGGHIGADVHDCVVSGFYAGSSQYSASRYAASASSHSATSASSHSARTSGVSPCQRHTNTEPVTAVFAVVVGESGAGGVGMLGAAQCERRGRHNSFGFVGLCSWLCSFQWGG